MHGGKGDVLLSQRGAERIIINHIYNDVIKRTVDFVIALVLFVVLFPLILVIAIFVRCDSKGTIFYKPLRGGYHDKPFRIYKFRTMVSNADRIGGSTTALRDERITRVGAVLRKNKLDEIPQLINILKGDMSFIGPRPELLQYTEQYSPLEKAILEVRPGITDISSLKFIALDEAVGAENADENYEKFILAHKNELRLEYVRTQRVGLDIKLFLSTVWGTVKKILHLHKAGK